MAAEFTTQLCTAIDFTDSGSVQFKSFTGIFTLIQKHW